MDVFLHVVSKTVNKLPTWYSIYHSIPSGRNQTKILLILISIILIAPKIREQTPPHTTVHDYCILERLAVIMTIDFVVSNVRINCHNHRSDKTSVVIEFLSGFSS